MDTRRKRRTRNASRRRTNTETKKYPTPVASSSPKHSDSEDRQETVNTLKENLEALKKEVLRQGRLIKFKIGAEQCLMELSKSRLADCAYQSYLQGALEKSTSCSNTASSRASRKDNFNGSKSSSNRTKTVTFSKLGDNSSSNSDSKSGSRRGGRVAVVTVGPEADRPFSVLRRPTAGELAVSLYGSPLLVASDFAPSSMPQINMPTADGKIVAILPKEGFSVSDMPTIATPTRQQLQLLNKYLNDVCNQA